MMRRFFVWLHRWSGLLMAAFLIIVGLTGSLLAFNTELERVCAPQLFAKPRPGAPRLDLATLAIRAERLVTNGRIFSVTNTEPDQILVYIVPSDAADASAASKLAFDELYLDPWTGDELGRRKRGDLSEGVINLMPFIYDLHWRLALGDIGQWTLGIVAVVWTIDCFVAFYLTLPLTIVAFWRRWSPAWLIKRTAGFYRLNFDLHRASGLWLWVLLFIFAWSSVMMNLRSIYDPVMQALFDYQPYVMPAQQMSKKPLLDWHAAQAAGERLIAEQALQRGFVGSWPLSLVYFSESNRYAYEVRGSRDVFERSPKGGGTSVTFDGDTGALIELSQPTGEHTGNTIESWLYALHMARVFGMPYRIFVCALGLAVVMLSITGIYLWWKKRSARSMSASRQLSQYTSFRN
jgi:uncharacterized iron-regulated membrane protein